MIEPVTMRAFVEEYVEIEKNAAIAPVGFFGSMGTTIKGIWGAGRNAVGRGGSRLEGMSDAIGRYWNMPAGSTMNRGLKNMIGTGAAGAAGVGGLAIGSQIGK